MSESPKNSVKCPCTCLEMIIIVCSVVFAIGVFTIPSVLYFSNRNEADQSWNTLTSAVLSVLETCDDKDRGMNNLTQFVSVCVCVCLCVCVRVCVYVCVCVCVHFHIL